MWRPERVIVEEPYAKERVERAAAGPRLIGRPGAATAAGDGQSASPIASALTTSAATAAAAAAGEPAAAQDPAAKQDSATWISSARLRSPGFVDTYYTYNFKRAKPCATVGGVAIFNCLHNFDVAHNSFSLNLAEVALEKKPTADSRAGFRDRPRLRPHGDHRPRARAGRNDDLSEHPAGLRQLSRAGGQGAAVRLRQVRDAGRQRGDRDQGQLELLARPAVRAGDSVLPHGPAHALRVNDKVVADRLPVNGWNNVRTTTRGKTVGGSVSSSRTRRLAIIENYIAGPEQTDDNDDWRHLSDTIVTYTATTRVSLAATTTTASDKVLGEKVQLAGHRRFARFQA